MARNLILLFLSVLFFQVQAQNPTVEIFLSEDCPISLSQSVELRQLEADYAEKVDFVYRFPMSVDEEAVKEFMRKAQLNAPFTMEGAFERAKEIGATTMPEVFLYNAEGMLTYRGRIDNSFAKVSQRNRGKQVRELHLAIERVLNDPGTFFIANEAVGCLISDKKVNPEP